METENGKIEIGFHFVDPYGNAYDSSSNVEVFYDLGDTELSVIGDKLNVFLRQCGYYRANDHILLNDLTDEEYSLVEDYLFEIRRKRTENDS